MRALSHRIALALLWLVGAVTMSGCAKEGPLFCTDCRCVIGIWEPQAPTQEPPSGIALPLVATPDGVFQFGSVQGGPIPIPAWRWDGEDWQNVQLSLVSGLPVSFISRLYEPRYLQRPVIQLAQDRAWRPTVHGGAVEDSKEQEMAQYRHALLGSKNVA